MPVSTSQILHPDRYVSGDKPRPLAFGSPGSDSVRYEDGLGEFEIRLLFEQLLGDERAAALLASGWAGDRYLVVTARGDDVLVWYTLWEDRASAARFFKGLGRAWARRRVGGPADRRVGIPQLTGDRERTSLNFQHRHNSYCLFLLE